MQTIRTMSLHSMMARRLAPGCCLESPSTPALNQVICDAGVKSANNAIHLSRLIMFFADLPCSLRPDDGKRSPGVTPHRPDVSWSRCRPARSACARLTSSPEPRPSQACCAAAAPDRSRRLPARWAVVGTAAANQSHAVVPHGAAGKHQQWPRADVWKGYRPCALLVAAHSPKPPPCWATPDSPPPLGRARRCWIRRN